MKIKSIAAICKKNKNIAIFERYSDDGDILTQYIGDGSNGLHEGRKGLPAQLLPFVRKAGEE